MTTDRGTPFTIVLGVLAAGALIWVATRIDGTTSWRYWASLGVLAAAGLVFALSQRASYAAWAVGAVAAFLLAFLPAAIAAGWIAVAGMPHSDWARNHVLAWSGDIGIRGLVVDLTRYVSVMAFAVGALLASAPALVAGRRRSDVPAAGTAVVPSPRPADAAPEATTATDTPPATSPYLRRTGRRDPAEV